MLLTGKNNIEEVKETDLWKTKFVKELINIREGFINVENFEDDELNEVLAYLCTS